MLPILSTLRIVNLGDIIVKTNIIKVTIFIIATTTTTIAINHGKKSAIFIKKKVVALISIQMMSNRR